MSDETKVRELLAPMQAIPIDTAGARFKVDREAVVGTILGAPSALRAARVARSRRLAWLGLAAGFAALVGAGSWALAHRAGSNGSAVAGSPGGRSLESQLHVSKVLGSVTQLQGASQVTLAPGDAPAVLPGSKLVTAEKSEASVSAVDGLDLLVFENTQVAFTEPRTVHLEAGAIRCHVPQLSAGERFSVITPDATVIVHGTVFSVAVGAATAATHTCVRVEEGEVSVQAARGETRLSSSQSWGCAAPVAATALSAPDSLARAASSKPERPSPPRAPADAARLTPAPPLTPGTLDEENRLFQAGLAAERRGDPRAAAESFELLLSRNPRSPLAADARAALARVRPQAP